MSGLFFSAGILAERTSSCAGDVLRASCPSGKVIAVQDVQYGTKLKFTCSLLNTSSGCCDFGVNDCFLPKYNDISQQKACSGKELCNDHSISHVETSSCGDSYPILNNYLTMAYDCIPGKALCYFLECLYSCLFLLKFYLHTDN